MKEKFNKINSLISQSKNILIAAHRSPDEDAVGSALALKLALRKQGIDSYVFIADYSPKEYNYLPGYDLINAKLSEEKFDLVFGLDYGDVRRLFINDIISKHNPTIITLDHHVDDGANHIGDVKIIEPVSSTAEIVYFYLKESNWPIDKDIATCILTGIIGDTGGFVHSNTSHRTLLTVGELLFKGIHINKVIKKILDNNSFTSNFQVLGNLLSRVEKHPDLDLVYLIVRNDDFDNWRKSDLDNLVSTINTAEDCKWALLLVEYEKGKTKGSLRSEEYKGVDVSKIASLFGGGGHKLASGFRVDGEPDKVFKQLIKRVEKVL